jgi:hypothetical protein
MQVAREEALRFRHRCVRGMFTLLGYGYETIAVLALQALYCTSELGRVSLVADRTQVCVVLFPRYRSVDSSAGWTALFLGVAFGSAADFHCGGAVRVSGHANSGCTFGTQVAQRGALSDGSCRTECRPGVNG